MNTVELALERVLGDLGEVADVAVVGGLAVSVRTEPRLTRDVDLAVSVADDARAEAVVRFLNGRRYVVRTMLEHRSGRLATVRLVPPLAGGVLVDLLFASSGIEAEVVASAERIQVIPGLVAPVATSSALLAMKVLSENDRGRPNDYDDIVNLLREPDVDLEEVRRLLGLIESRGFSRGKDLQERLAHFVSKGSSS